MTTEELDALAEEFADPGCSVCGGRGKAHRFICHCVARKVVSSVVDGDVKVEVTDA